MKAPCPGEQLLDLYYRGELSPAETAEVRAHLATCEICRDRTLGLAKDESLLADLRVVADRAAEDAAAPASFEPGEGRGARFGPYVLQDLLGAGGMSKVYRAVHVETGQVVALKLLRGEYQASDEVRLRFEREAAAMSRLEHPNIVRVFGCCSDHGRVGLAMEVVPGGSLRAWLSHDAGQPNPCDPAKVLEASLQAARGLGAAHAAGLVHRDVKPSNLLLDGEARTKVSDFGVVQALESATWITGTGRQIGTPAYMSPEQCKGERATPASDVYSLGVTMFELATGRLPFDVEGDSPLAHMLRHISEPAPDPCRFNPRISHRFALVILRCLEKAPQDRYADGDVLCTALASAARAEAPPDRPTPPHKHAAHVNLSAVRRQLEELPQRSIVAWACRLARRVQPLNPDTRVARAIELAESAAISDRTGDQPASTRILAHMQGLRGASLAAACADGDASEAAIAAARAAAATSSTAAARCAADAAADAVFALQNALLACRKGKLPLNHFWRQAQHDFRRLRQANLGAPGTIGQPVPVGFWESAD